MRLYSELIALHLLNSFLKPSQSNPLYFVHVFCKFFHKSDDFFNTFDKFESSKFNLKGKLSLLEESN
jgi:hypothetical protein